MGGQAAQCTVYEWQIPTLVSAAALLGGVVQTRWGVRGWPYGGRLTEVGGSAAPGA